MRVFSLISLELLVVAGGIAGSSAQQAVVRGVCLDAATGLPTSCTVTISDATGRALRDRESFTSGFRCAGRFEKLVPAGRARIRVTRGFEIESVERDLELQPGSETSLTFHLRRRVDMRSRGWYAGDSHAHMLHGERTVSVDFDFAGLSARAEDLQYLSLAQDWPLEQATPERLETQLRSLSTSDCLLTWNLEAPKNYYKGDAGRCLGHCWTLGMKGRTPDGRDVIQTLLDASAGDYESEKPTFANFESHRLIHEQGGAVFYTHPARWWMGSWGGQGGYPKTDRMKVSNMAVELPLDTLLGPTYDGIDVLTSRGEREANAKAFAIWTMLLNHGYRLAATGSSDSCFDRPGGATPGSARTYTFLPGRFSLSKVTKATTEGRTVATTGPLLIPLIDGKPPGSIFSAGRKQRLLSIEAWSAGDTSEGLDSVEVLRNGTPWKQFELESKPTAFETNLAICERENAWYCVRVSSGPGQPRLAISGAFYFADGARRLPTPVMPHVHAKVVDASTGQLLPATLIEVEFSGPSACDGKRHQLKTGEGWLPVPPTVRLKADSPGYGPVTLSPFLDDPALLEDVTTLTDADLTNWAVYDRIRARLANVELVFRLRAR